MMMAEDNRSIFPSYLDFRSRVIHIGDLALGGELPVRVQSMTNTPTMDTGATVRQVIELARAGCELVRITAQNLAEARNLSEIKHRLKGEGFRLPLAADIHYLPEAAEMAARIVEKVRINPGNYAEKKSHGTQVYSDREYEEGLERVHGRLLPLLKICREHGTTLRIGTNHGSLSDRIMHRYGNTPAGMVESALEFVRICRMEGFHNLVISMKASNILTVLHANRLLVARMKSEGMDYPIHLGVTEAGEGEDGRIKSAIGIGVLLSEGIGDTIRVSLTEDPALEIPFARKLACLFQEGENRIPVGELVSSPYPFHYQRHRTQVAGKIGGEKPPEVFTGAGFPTPEFPTPEFPTPGILFHHSPSNENALALRKKIHELTGKNPGAPLVINKDLGGLSGDDFLIRAAIDMGIVLTDGFGDGIRITSGEGVSDAQRDQLALDILQATGRRISKTEYISCPSCGRTQFDIQKALREVKKKTAHLVGLKIAVMGCIVNGPGEMADADYGYVGAGPGKVHIYKGQRLVKRNVPEETAIDELLNIIHSPPTL
jgi:(E)-4-hydroxy-3-methylbut-2-enyl-diphosphate synthase